MGSGRSAPCGGENHVKCWKGLNANAGLLNVSSVLWPSWGGKLHFISGDNTHIYLWYLSLRFHIKEILHNHFCKQTWKAHSSYATFLIVLNPGEGGSHWVWCWQGRESFWRPLNEKPCPQLSFLIDTPGLGGFICVSASHTPFMTRNSKAAFLPRVSTKLQPHASLCIHPLLSDFQ